MKTLFSLLLVVIIGTGTSTFSQTLTIGTQVWMTKNLDVSTFRNGDPIPEAKTNEEWIKAGEEGKPAWCYYNNDTVYGRKYGKLYNWYAVNDARGLAPSGYHVPTDTEWGTLETFLGNDAGTKMKSKTIYETKVRYVEEGGYYETKWVACNNCSYWTEKQKANNPCTVCRNQRGKLVKTGKYIPKTKRKIEEKSQIGGWNGTNQSGFSGLPGGYRDPSGTFNNVGAPSSNPLPNGSWWCFTEYNTDDSWFCLLYSGNSLVNMYWEKKVNGFSVRCILD